MPSKAETAHPSDGTDAVDDGVRFHEATHFAADDVGTLAPVLSAASFAFPTPWPPR
jgi:hypothetical protein